jgi:hypothetical protein
MKGIALIACLAVVPVGVLVVSLLPFFYPPSPEPEWRDPDPPTMCELVRKYEPNQPLREHICRPPSVREQIEEQQRVREPEGMELRIRGCKGIEL